MCLPLEGKAHLLFRKPLSLDPTAQPRANPARRLRFLPRNHVGDRLRPGERPLREDPEARERLPLLRTEPLELRQEVCLPDVDLLALPALVLDLERQLRRVRAPLRDLDH